MTSPHPRDAGACFDKEIDAKKFEEKLSMMPKPKAGTKEASSQKKGWFGGGGEKKEKKEKKKKKKKGNNNRRETKINADGRKNSGYHVVRTVSSEISITNS